MTEIELKFLIDEKAEEHLKTRLNALQLVDGGMRPLRSIYFDTPDHALHRSGYSIRLRLDGGRWIQTVKSRSGLRRGLRSGLHSGLSRVSEFECPAGDGELHLDNIADKTARKHIKRLISGKRFDPVCETHMNRTSAQIGAPDGTRAELSVDHGKILAGALSAELREMEIELIAGTVDGLFDLARDLLTEGGFRFSCLSKSDRGYLLAEEGRIDVPMHPRMAKPVPLHAKQTVGEAARDILRECFDQITGNIDLIRASKDPAGPHQLRVGLRRLRSAFVLFCEQINKPEMKRLNEEAKWLGQEIGALRDRDVTALDIVRPMQQSCPDEPSFAALSSLLAAERAKTRKHVRHVLKSQRAMSFLLDLARVVETMPIGKTGEGDMPIGKLAKRALDRRWKSVREHAKAIEKLTGEERHTLRKELKKLRYTVEFMAPFFSNKRVAPFTRQLKQLQSVFGELIDAAMIMELFSGETALGAQDPAAQRAIGWVIGTRMTKSQQDWHEAKSLWKDLKDTGAFWG